MDIQATDSALLDREYGESGVAHPHDTTFSLSASLRTPSGSLCVGQARTGSSWGYCLLRVDHSGKLDKTFGDAGITIGQFKDGSPSEGLGLHILPDERIILRGSYRIDDAPFPALARFTKDGKLDVSFQDEGHLLIPVPSRKRAAKQSSPSSTVEPANDGVFVIYQYPWSHSLLMRFDADGNFDKRFNGSGYKYLRASDHALGTSANRLVTHDRKIYLSGSTNDKKGLKPCLICLKNTGAEDKEFNGTGYLVLDLTPTTRLADVAILDKTGNIVCAGDENFKGILAAFTPQGKPLTGFTPSKTEFGHSGGQWTRLEVDSARQRIITVGTSLGGDEADVLVGRFNLDGTPDQAFAEHDGWGRIALGNSIDLAAGMALQPDGKTLISGSDFEESDGPFTRQGFILRCLTNV